MKNLFFISNAPTHAQLWWIVETEESPATQLNERYTVKGRDGQIYFVWYSIFATMKQMTDSYTGTIEMLEQMDDEYRSVVLSV